MKAVTVRMDDEGLEGFLQQVKLRQELGFDRFDLCIRTPQAPFGRLVKALRDHHVSLCALRLSEPRKSVMVARKAGYGKLGAADEALAARSLELVVQTAEALAPAQPKHLILEGGYLPVPGLMERQQQLDELLDCEDCAETRAKKALDLADVGNTVAERSLETLCRSLHAVCRRVAPLPVCLMPTESPFGLLTPERMQIVLDDLASEGVGYWHSTSHAAVLEKLGIARAHDWIDRFSARMRGVYLADALGAHLEQVPGLGEVDFSALGQELGRATVRVLVVDDDSGTKLKFGSDYLSKVGIF